MPGSNDNYTPLTAHLINSAQSTKRSTPVNKPTVNHKPTKKISTKRSKPENALIPAIGTVVLLDISKVSRKQNTSNNTPGTPLARIFYSLLTKKWELRKVTESGMLVFLNSVPTNEKLLVITSITDTQTACYANVTNE